MIIYGGGKGGRIHRNVQPAIIKEKAEATRVCRLCGKEKPLTAYYKDAKLKLGRAYDCKACVKAREKAKYVKRGNPIAMPCIIKDLETGKEVRFSTATKAAEAIGCGRPAVTERLNGKRDKPIYGRYEVRREDEQD